VDLNGFLTTVRGDFRILSTDTGTPSNERLRIFGNASGASLTIEGNLEISGPSSVTFSFAGTDNTLFVGGNYSNSATIRTTFAQGVGSLEMFVQGNYTQSGLVNRLTTNAAGIFNLYLQGNLSHATSNISSTAGSQPNIYFVSDGLQIYSGAGAVSGPINYFVEGSTQLDVGTSALRGTGSFTLRSTATLLVGAVNGSGANGSGAIQNSTTTGNIRVPIANRFYEDESTIIYNGTQAQQLGSGHPSTTIVNTIINNPAGVSVSGSPRTVSGDLTLQSGNLTLAATAIFTLNRNISAGSNFIIPAAAGTSDLVINGDGLVHTFPFPATPVTIRDFTLNRSGGRIVFNTNVTITRAVNLTNGELEFSGRTLVLNGTLSAPSGTLASNSSASVLQIGGGGAFGTLVMAAAPENQVGTLTFNRGTTGTLTNATNINVVNTFNLNNGNFINSGSIVFSDGANLNRTANAATITVNRPTVINLGNTYNVSYTGGTIDTGLEIPDEFNDTDLGNLTITAGTINLGQALFVNGNVNLNGGTLNAGANTITMQGLQWNDNGGTFGPGTGLVIFNSSAGTVIGGSSIPLFGNLTLNDGASLTLPSGDITINGNIQINSASTLNANSGTIILGGGTSTTFAGGAKTCNNITLQKGGGADVTLTSGVNLAGQLSVVNNGNDFASNGLLTLLSNASSTASIGILPGGRTVSGNVNVQRYIQGVGRFYRHISSPVLNPTVQQIISSGVTITGPFTGTSFPCAGCATNNPSFYYYDETVAGVQNNGWIPYPPSGGSSATSTLDRGRGYYLFVRAELGSPTTTLSGSINSGTIPLPVTYTTTIGGTDNDGWNFVGNPYPSAIDWDIAGGWTKTNITGNQISIWDPTKGTSGGFRVWNGTLGDLGSGRIASGQGFWIKTNPAPALTVNETAKTNTLTAFYREGENQEAHYLHIALEGNGNEDNAYIQLTEEASAGHDQYDGYKLPLEEELSFATLSRDNKKLSINALKELTLDEEIPVELINIAPGSYTFTRKSVGMLSGVPIFIRDNFLRTISEFDENKPYSFEIKDIAGSRRKDRFSLVFKSSVNSFTESLVSIYPNPVEGKLNLEVYSQVRPAGTVIDLSGKSIGEITWQEIDSNIWQGSLSMQDNQSGIYIASVQTHAGFERIKFVKK
jgi:hypothetical protein